MNDNSTLAIDMEGSDDDSVLLRQSLKQQAKSTSLIGHYLKL